MLSKSFDLRLKNVLSFIYNIKNDIKGITYNDFIKDRRRQDSVLFNLTRTSWAIKRMEENFPNEMKQFPENKIVRLSRLSSIIDVYANDLRNTWKIISSDLEDYEKMFSGKLKSKNG